MNQVPSEPARSRLSAARLLEAVSPHLDAELERLLEEFRQNLKAEADVRLKKKLLDTEAELRSQFEEEVRRVQDETTEAVSSQVTRELEASFEQKLAAEQARLRAQLEGEASRALASWTDERKNLAAEIERWRTLARFQKQAAQATSQVAMLNLFLGAASPLVEGVAIYVNKADGLAQWKTHGQIAFPELVSEETTDPEWQFEPIVVRSKKIAAICGAGVADKDAFRFLTAALTRAIENFALRARFLGTTTEIGSENISPDDGNGEADRWRLTFEARRLARMLVSEIKVRHDDEVQEGRIHRDLYARLQKEIDRGWLAYRNQVGDSAADYFHEELIKILAADDPAKLGDDYPGPRKADH